MTFSLTMAGFEGGTAVLHALQNVRVLLQGEEGVIAEAQLVRGAAAFQTNLALASVEECDGVEVGIGELQHLVAAGGAVNAGELVLPHAGLEELFCKGQVRCRSIWSLMKRTLERRGSMDAGTPERV